MTSNKTIRQLREENPAIKTYNSAHIYIYNHPDYPKHDGWIKIGYTDDDVKARVKHLNHTNHITYKILADIEAIDDNGNIFKDKDIHYYLRTRGIENANFDDTGNNSEWFKMDAETAIKTINNRKHLIDDFEFLKSKKAELDLYPSQREAVNKTKARYELALQNKSIAKGSIKKFLWNAKPRFGKTLASYILASEINAKRVLIMTARTSVSNAWFEDFFAHINGSKYDHNYAFGSSKENRHEKGYHAISTKESIARAKDQSKGLIYYTSQANIRGKTERQFKESNKWIFNTDWDLIILDETHEGTSTDLFRQVIDEIPHTFLLELSGTPFRKLNSDKDYSTENTFAWNYIDEQEAKENWDISKGENPYANLPKLNIFAFQMPSDIQNKLDASPSEYSFNFTEFFANDGTEFRYSEEIDTFLDILSLKNDRYDDEQIQYYPFADNDTRDMFRHTLWRLPNVNSVKLLAHKLRNHNYFKNYEIITATGSNEGNDSMKAEAEVKQKIGKNPFETRTITLTNNMLTTGTTIPEWTAVLMLYSGSDGKGETDAQSYIQTAFRSQTPFKYNLNGKLYRKTNAYVFDFAPDRVLKVADTYANIDVNGYIIKETKNDGDNRTNNTQTLLNYLPVITMDENGKMRSVDARDALNIINYSSARSIVDHGFMSNDLFNFGVIFRLPKTKYDTFVDIANNFEAVKPNKKVDKSKGELDKEREDSFQDKVLNQSELGKGVKAAIIDAYDKADGDTELAVEIIEQNTEDYDEDMVKEAIQATKQYANELEDEIKTERKKKKTREQLIKEKMAGFSRTMSVYLMAYGMRGKTTLANFGNSKEISAEDFKQICGITKEEFDWLRKLTNDQGEPAINQAKFDAAIEEFLRRKERLKNYYKTLESEDIYSYIPAQKSDRIFTPKSVVNQMLDTLEKEHPGIFKSNKIKFLDPGVKSGQFLSEIARRLYKHQRHNFNSDEEAIIHIIKHQLFGIAVGKVYQKLAQETLFHFVKSSSYSKEYYNLCDNIIFVDDYLEKIKQPNALNEIIDREFEDMKFDVIIGNPPYNDGNHGQLYPFFYINAIESANHVCMIFPIGWQEPKNGNNLRLLNNKEIKEDSQIISIDNKYNVFPSVPGADYTNIILWEKGYDNNQNGLQKILTEGKNPQLIKLLIDKTDIEKPFELLQLEKIVKNHEKNNFKSMQTITSVRKPYGLSTDVIKDSKKYGLPSIFDTKQSKDDIVLYGPNRKQYYISKNYPLPRVTNAFNKFKVLVPYAWGGSSKEGQLGGAFADIVIAKPYEACTETYQEQGAYETKQFAQYHAKYIMTKFARALLFINKYSHHSTTAWGSIPIQNFKEPWWSEDIATIDNKLMDKYSVPEDIRDFIYNNIQTKNENNIINL